MKRIIKKICLLPVIIGMLGIGWPASSWALMLSFEPDTQNVELGNLLGVGVKISELGNSVAPSLGTYDLDITYNSAVLDFVDIVFGDPNLGNQVQLFLPGATVVNEPAAGTVNVFEASIDNPNTLNNQQADEFILAILRFSTLALGSSLLDISVIQLGDASGAPLQMPVTINTGLVNVVEPTPTIPEPSIVLLLVASLLGVSVGTRKTST